MEPQSEAAEPTQEKVATPVAEETPQTDNSASAEDIAAAKKVRSAASLFMGWWKHACRGRPRALAGLSQAESGRMKLAGRAGWGRILGSQVALLPV